MSPDIPWGSGSFYVAFLASLLPCTSFLLS